MGTYYLDIGLTIRIAFACLDSRKSSSTQPSIDSMTKGAKPVVSLNRRVFIATSAASLAATSIGRLPAQMGGKNQPWYETMRRCGHLNFNEQDPLTMDVGAWTDYFVSLKVDTLMPNGGGIMAFYPTAIPFHHRSQFLGTRDLFGETVAAARKHNIRIVARMDCNYAYEDAFLAHPEWFEFNKDGSPRRHSECPWLYKTCVFSNYFTEQMTAIYRELSDRSAPDAFYTNGWPGTDAPGVCYCQNCQKVYSEQTGGVPPQWPDTRSYTYRKYYDAYMNRVTTVWALWQNTSMEKNSNSVYAGNLSGIRTVKNVNKMGKDAAWFYADNQGRSGDTPIWMCAQEGRLARAVAGKRTVTNSVGSYASGTPGWRHTSKTKEETTLWLAQATASGMVPSYHWLGGNPLDTRWKETGRAFYSWLAENENHFKNRNTLANIAALYPQATISFYGANGARERKLNGQAIDTTDYLEGLYAALVEGRFLFDFVHEENLSPDVLKKYRVLLIPNAAYLRDRECEAIRAFVASGGSVRATFETSRYNEWGEQRADFALKDVFGVSTAGALIGPYGNSYMHKDKAHPVLDGFDGTEILPGPEFRVPVTRIGSEENYLSVIPNYPSFPPEMVYPKVRKTDEPAAMFRQVGSARIAYFPGDIDRTFLRSGHPDFSKLLINSIHWLMNGADAPARVEGDGLVELFAWETEPGFALHLLNYTNPGLTHPFVSKFYATGPHRVTFHVPGGRRIGSVMALRESHKLEFKQAGAKVTFEIPRVVDYEVVALT
jgi:hypothetical protein